MAVIFGDTREDGKIVVGCVQYQIESHPNGTKVDKVPDYPQPTKGKNDVMLYDPKTKQFSFEKVDRPLTPDEQMADNFAMLGQKLDQIIALLSPQVKK
jgi:hypothetical protein